MDETFIVNGMKTAMAELIGKKYEKMKEDLVYELDMEKDQLIAGIVLNISKHMSVERFGENIQITIKNETTPPPTK